ncbi:MAG TPA: hypothetical protein VGP64_11870 [Polyangia bacterium]|jgi:hypothetical protein
MKVVAGAWSAVLAFALALAVGIAAARCSVDVPLGVDPRSDAAHLDAGDAGAP